MTQEARNLTPENSKGMTELVMTIRLVSHGSRAEMDSREAPGFCTSPAASPTFSTAPTTPSSGAGKMGRWQNLYLLGPLQAGASPTLSQVIIPPALLARHSHPPPYRWENQSLQKLNYLPKTIYFGFKLTSVCFQNVFHVIPYLWCIWNYGQFLGLCVCEASILWNVCIVLFVYMMLGARKWPRLTPPCLWSLSGDTEGSPWVV